MNTHADKTQENKSQSVASTVSQKQNTSDSTFQFVDNRPEAVAQRKLQEMANNSSIVKQLKSVQNFTNGTIQFADHRPAVGMTINYQNHNWTVQLSAPNNTQITIHRNPNHTQHINWRNSNFTIIRQNNTQDHDLRQGAGTYDAPGFMSQRENQILARFAQAKTQALTMIKNTARPHVNQANLAALDHITLDDFSISQVGLTLIGPSSKQPTEWELTWLERDRRTWKFIIDVDNPEAESHQEPHVGWEVSARAGTQAAVNRVLGHVWLDYVPTSRGQL